MKPISFPESPAWRLFAWSVLCLLTRYFYLHFFLVSSWTPEESLRGTVALEFYNALHGNALRLPFWCHQADQYLGGSLVTSALTALNYHLFGIRLIALKSSALFFTLAGLWLAYRWLLKENGQRVADTFALLYCLATPHFIALGEVAMGYHTESVAFVGWMLCAAAAAARDPRSALARFSFGLAAGLGFWFSNINALAALAICAAYPALVRPRQLIALGIGAILGLVPWLAFNAANDFGSIAQLLESFSGSSFAAKRNYGGSIFLKIWLMVVRDLPLSYGLGKVGFAYSAVIGAILVWPFSGWKGPVQRLLLAYALLFLLAYGCSNFYLGVRSSDSVHYRYLHQFAFFTYAALALALERFAWRNAALSCLIGFSAYGAFLQDGSMPPGRVWAYRPQSYEALSAKVMNSCYAPAERFPELLRWMHSFPEREALFAQIPFEGAYNFAPLVARKASAEWPRDNPYFAEGLGEYFGEKIPDHREVLAAGALFSGEQNEKFWRGVVKGSRVSVIVESDLQEHFSPGWRKAWMSFSKNIRYCFDEKILQPESDPWAARGQGFAIVDCGVYWFRTSAFAEALAAGQSSEYRENLAWGMGWRLRFRHISDPLYALDKLRKLPAWAQENAIQGAVDFERDQHFPVTESVKNAESRGPAAADH